LHFQSLSALFPEYFLTFRIGHSKSKKGSVFQNVIMVIPENKKEVLEANEMQEAI